MSIRINGRDNDQYHIIQEPRSGFSDEDFPQQQHPGILTGNFSGMDSILNKDHCFPLAMCLLRGEGIVRCGDYGIQRAPGSGFAILFYLQKPACRSKFLKVCNAFSIHRCGKAAAFFVICQPFICHYCTYSVPARTGKTDHSNLHYIRSITTVFSAD